jgi:predicted metal-dependent peptidase
MMEDQANGRERGFLPGSLIDELDLRGLANETLDVPEWKAELAEWFNIQFAPKPPRRSYSRPSRRQASTPDIPRPGMSPLDFHSPTFGVVLDTSGSMSQELLQRGLGAVYAFSERHGVAQIRLVMCDTQAYDEGFVPLGKLREPFHVWGRGGTILQPAIDVLEKSKDFPPDAPILIVTDGEIDNLKIEREHAYLLPGDGKLPFEPQGPVFQILGNNERRFGGRPFRPSSSSRSGSSSQPKSERVQKLIDKIKEL